MYQLLFISCAIFTLTSSHVIRYIGPVNKEHSSDGAIIHTADFKYDKNAPSSFLDIHYSGYPIFPDSNTWNQNEEEEISDDEGNEKWDEKEEDWNNKEQLTEHKSWSNSVHKLVKRQEGRWNKELERYEITSPRTAGFSNNDDFGIPVGFDPIFDYSVL